MQLRMLSLRISADAATVETCRTFLRCSFENNKKPNVQQLNGRVVFEGMSVQLVFFIFLFCGFVLQSAIRQLRLAVRRFPV